VAQGTPKTARNFITTKICLIIPKLKRERKMASGLYANIHAKRERIKRQKKAGKKVERMRKPGSKGAPTDSAFKKAARSAKRK